MPGDIHPAHDELHLLQCIRQWATLVDQAAVGLGFGAHCVLRLRSTTACALTNDGDPSCLSPAHVVVRCTLLASGNNSHAIISFFDCSRDRSQVFYSVPGMDFLHGTSYYQSGGRESMTMLSLIHTGSDPLLSEALSEHQGRLKSPRRR